MKLCKLQKDCDFKNISAAELMAFKFIILIIDEELPDRRKGNDGKSDDEPDETRQ